MELNSNQFRQMYAELGINLDTLGCVMLDVDGSLIKNIIDEKDLYVTANKARFWINGFVAGHTPHVTLLYGLMHSANTLYRRHVDTVLKGWSIDEVQIDGVGYFDSPYPDDPYFCIVAHLYISPKLMEGHKRLEFIPHINTFIQYKAHITLAYIRKDEELKNSVIDQYSKMLNETKLKVKGINYGK